MVDFSRVAVVIPALNEASTIGRVARQARQLGVHVYVVDDASTDDTYQEAVAEGATVLRLPYTSGAWMAVQAGLRYAFKQRAHDYFITLDADGQHGPEYIPELIRAYEQGSANTLIGSCPQRGSRARRIVWSLFARMTGLGITDLTSGFRLYDQEALAVLLSREGVLLDYQDVGVLLLLRRNGVVCKECPIEMGIRACGHSKIFNSWLDVFNYIVKTIIWILADWISAGIRRPCKL